MSRQEVGRAALRSLTSHVEMEEGDDRRQHYDPVRQSYNQQQQSSSSSSSTSYFGGDALQITDSPSTSPILGPAQFQRLDSLPRTRTGRSRIGQSSSGTPTTSDVPSLSLSNSSFSDGPLRSPLSEHADSQASISSSRTVLQHHHAADNDDDHQDTGMLQSTLIRVANSLQMPLDDVRRVERCMSQDFSRVKDQESILIEDLGRERFNKIVGAVRAEEDRQSQLSTFRSAYLRADIDTQQRIPHYTARPTPIASRSAGFGSPPPSYDQLDFLDRSGPIPSPRAALELLTASSSHAFHQGSPHSPLQGFEQSFSRGSPHRHSHWNTSTSTYHTHTRQTSAGSRPTTLPDRSYRSMDDYVPQPPLQLTSPVLRGESRLSIRRSIHDLITSPNVKHPPLSRQSSRSPLIGSPQEDDDMEETLDDEESPPNRTRMQHLRPGPASSRQRSASGNDYETHSMLSKASRRASAEVLGQAFKRASSPLVIREEDSTSSTQKSPPVPSVSSTSTLSHEEVMARLQRKVKERLAAKNAGLDYSSSNVIVGGRSKSMKATSSPVMSKHSSLPYGTLPASLGRSSGRKRQESASNMIPPSSTRRSSSNSRRQVKSPSLRGIARELEQRADEEDAKMDDISSSSPIDSSTAGMGIEALLSAAAIADNPRPGFI